MRALKQYITTAFLALGIASTANAVLPIEKLESVKGGKAYLVRTQALPMVDIEVSIDAGDRYDPPNKSGLADMTAAMMKYGARGKSGLLTEAQIADDDLFRVLLHVESILCDRQKLAPERIHPLGVDARPGCIQVANLDRKSVV